MPQCWLLLVRDCTTAPSAPPCVRKPVMENTAHGKVFYSNLWENTAPSCLFYVIAFLWCHFIKIVCYLQILVVVTTLFMKISFVFMKIMCHLWKLCVAEVHQAGLQFKPVGVGRGQLGLLFLDILISTAKMKISTRIFLWEYP